MKQEKKRGKGACKECNGLRKRNSKSKRAKIELREHSVHIAVGQYDALANLSAVFLFHKLSSWPSSHQDLVPLPRSLTDSPIQLFKVYKQETSILAAHIDGHKTLTIGKRKINYSDRHHVNILMVLSGKKSPSVYKTLTCYSNNIILYLARTLY